MGIDPSILHAKGYRPDGKGGLSRPLTPPPLPPPRDTSHNRRLNAVETRWLAVLTERHPAAVIQPQFRVRLTKHDAAMVVHFTADFACWFRSRFGLSDFWMCSLWEVKDKRRKGHSDELVRAKMARDFNPWVAAVYLASWNGKVWDERKLA